MAAEYVGIVYGIGDQLIHKIVVPDNDSELDDRAFVAPGELMMRVVRSVYDKHDNHVSLAKAVGLLG